MYPDEFEYHAPTAIPEAVALLEETDEFETEILAGGHSLLPTMKTGFASPNTIIDIGNIDALRGIDRTDEYLTVGALTTYNEIVDSEVAAADAPVIQEAASKIGDEQVRNRGTIGGNLAHADPASDLPGAAMAADAEIVAQGPDGERVYDANNFYAGMYATSLGEAELVSAIRFPRTSGQTLGAYGKKESPASGYAMVGVAATLDVNGSTIEDARIAANGVMDHAVRLDEAERTLQDARLTADAIERAADHATDGLDEDRFLDDLQASGRFRANLLEVYTRRTLERVRERSSV